MEILPQLFINALIAGSIYALASSGLALSYGLLKILNFAHGHLLMAGAYCFYALSVQMQLPLLACAAGTFVFAAILGAVVLRVFVLPFSRFSFLLTFITSLALANILEASVCMIYGPNVHSLFSGDAGTSFQIGSIYITPIQIFIILSALILLIALAVVVQLTPVGRRLRALSQNPTAAEAIGVSRTRISYMVFMVATVLAAYAGVLIGHETSIQPIMGAGYTVKAFAVMVLGGLGNLWGTVVASYILGLIENLSIGLDFGGYSVPAGYKDAFAFVIILLTLLIKPEGIFSRSRRRD